MRQYLGYPVLATIFLITGLVLGAWLAAPPDPGPDGGLPAGAGEQGDPAGHVHAGGPGATPSEAAPAAVWTCSMHPQIRLPEPGSCPICGMDLIEVASGPVSPEGAAVVTLSEDAVRRAGLRTVVVEQRPVDLDIRMVGAVHYDDTKVARITAWLGGRIERMFVDYAGTRVKKGDHLLELYSPALLVAQQELLQASREARRLGSVGSEIVRESSEATLKAATEKLSLWGLQSWQIRSILKRGAPLKTVTIYAPIGGTVTQKTALEGSYVETGSPIYTIADLSSVWVVMHAYESDVQWLRYGQPVEFEVAAYAGQTFKGTISFIAPTLDPRTRTVDVRINVDNSGLLLKPEMFVRARVRAHLGEPSEEAANRYAGQWVCPMHPEVIQPEPGKCGVCGMSLVPAEEHWLVGTLGRHLAGDVAPLVVPASAPLRTGRRSVVFVQRPDSREPSYELREVTLGPLAGDVYVVYQGLQVGERVVAEGAFKLDSALQIRGDRSLLSLPGSGEAEGPQGPAATAEGRLAQALRAVAERTGGGREALTVEELTDIVQSARDLRSYSLLVLGPAAWLEEAVDAPARQAALALVVAMAQRVEGIGDLSGLAVESPARVAGFEAALAELIKAAQAVSVALAADELDSAWEARDVLVTAVRTLEELGEGAIDPALDRAAEALAALEPKPGDGGEEAGIDELRARFANLNGAMIPLALAESDALAPRFQLAFCSMALDTGAFWLQPEGELANPYYGAQMLRCGETVGTYGGAGDRK